MAQALANDNKVYFDKVAADYDMKPWQRLVTVAVTEELRKELDFIGVAWATSGNNAVGREVRLLDYACGTGIVTMALKPYVTQIRGIDISPNMVARYNDTMQAAGLPAATAHAVEGNLIDPVGVAGRLSIPDLSGFDIAAVGLGFHHFESPALTIKRLAERLNPGGVVLIIDLVADDDEEGLKQSKAGHTIKTHGFSEQTMKEIFEGEGLEGVGYHIMQKPVKLGMDEDNLRQKHIFLARAQKKRV